MCVCVRFFVRTDSVAVRQDGALTHLNVHNTHTQSKAVGGEEEHVRALFDTLSHTFLNVSTRTHTRTYTHAHTHTHPYLVMTVV